MQVRALVTQHPELQNSLNQLMQQSVNDTVIAEALQRLQVREFPGSVQPEGSCTWPRHESAPSAQ